MPTRHRRRLRAFLALGLMAGLLPLVVTSPAEAICLAPEAAMPESCCPESAPPACPACPAEGRSSCPTQPARARTSCSLAVLPPGGAQDEVREGRIGEPDSPGARNASPSAARSRAKVRRDVVLGASPPVRLLACTFRN